MASIRHFDLGNCHVEWHTGSIRGLYFNEDDIMNIYLTEIKPVLSERFNDNNYREIRSVVKNLCEELIIKHGSTMKALVDVIYALRTTEISAYDKDENGFYKVYHLKPAIDSMKKITFYNIAYHMNHHCKQTQNFCLIKYTQPGSIRMMSYTTGEGYDKHHGSAYDMTDLFAADKKKKTTKSKGQ